MKRAWRVLLSCVALAVLATGPTVGQRGGFKLPSVSVRKTDLQAGRAAMTRIVGWRLAVRTDRAGAPTFFEAVANADAAGLAFVEAVSTQHVSPDVPKTLDHNLTPAQVEKVMARLDERRLRVGAYRLDVLPADEAARRKAFEFGKLLGAPVIVVPAEPSVYADLDKLAADLDVRVAVAARDAQSAAAALTSRSKRMWLAVDLADWTKAGFAGRVLVLNLGDRARDAEKALLELSRQQPPVRPPDYPPAPGHDGGGSKQDVRPVVITLNPAVAGNAVAELTRLAAAFDSAVRPAVREYVDALARLTVISTSGTVPAEQRQRIAAAVPHQASVKPRRARRLLVLDLAYNGSFYHGSTPLGNLSLQLMSEYTGAFTPVFSNDLGNLKYPNIKQFDGVFLNQIQGDLFDDELAIEGLTRYVREGGGVAGLHASTWASPNTPEFGDLMGATSGAHKFNGEMGAIRVDDPNSPLTRSFDARSFEWLDEFYHYIPTGPFSREKLHVLLSLDPSRTDLPGNQYTTRPDNDYGLVWIRRYGDGRVFNTGLGHRPEFYESAKMQQMLLAGIQFILGDLDADTTPSAKR